MPENDRFNMVLSPEQKAQWEEYADENPHVDSVSHLVRLAVQKEMTEDAPKLPGTGIDPGRIDELVTHAQQISSRIDSVEHRLVGIEKAVQDDPEVQRLSNDVMSILPTEDQLHDSLSADHARDPFTHLEDGHGEIDLAFTGTIGHLASVLGEDEYMVKRAIEELQSTTSRVYTIDEDGTRYYKEV